MTGLARVRLLVLDIDGVLTDGRVYLDEQNGETKSLYYRDLDALGEARRAGIELALLTGEESPMVSVLAGRLGIERVKSGCKDKLAGMRKIIAETGIAAEEAAYIGDARRDLPALLAVAAGFCPADAHPALLAESRCRKLARKGGSGAVEEAIGLILAALSTR